MGGECNDDKQQTSKSQKTYHNPTVWRGNQSTKLAEVSNLSHQTKEAVQNRNKNKQRQGEEQEKKQNYRPGGPGNLAGTPRGSFLVSTGAKVSDGRSMSRWTYLTNRSYSKLVVPTMILRVNRPKLRRHLEVPAQRASSTMNAYFVGKTDFAGVDAADETEDETEAVRDRAASVASARRAAGLEEGTFGDGDDLTEAVPPMRDGSSRSRQRNRRRRHRWNNSSRPTRRIKINCASPN